MGSPAATIGASGGSGPPHRGKGDTCLCTPLAPPWGGGPWGPEEPLPDFLHALQPRLCPTFQAQGRGPRAPVQLRLERRGRRTVLS